MKPTRKKWAHGNLGTTPSSKKEFRNRRKPLKAEYFKKLSKEGHKVTHSIEKNMKMYPFT